MKMDRIDPERFGFSSRVRLYQKDTDTYVIRIVRKSRVIMKDAQALVNKKAAIDGIYPGAALVLETSAPVCSKSAAYLNDHGIDIVNLDE
jgi:hypothetical protein